MTRRDLDEERVDHLVGFAGNSALEARVEPLMRAVRVLSATSGKTETLFADIQYQTKTSFMQGIICNVLDRLSKPLNGTE